MAFTPFFWYTVAAFALVAVLGFWYYKRRIEPVTEQMRAFMDTITGWRTEAFSLAVFVLGFLEMLDPYTISSLFGYEARGWVIMGIGLAIWLLRQITNSPPAWRRGRPEDGESSE